MAISKSNITSLTIQGHTTATARYDLTASFTEDSTDVTNNTSSITVSAKLESVLGSFSDNGGTLKLYWYDNKNNTNGKLITSETISAISQKGSKTITGTVSATHDDDGTLKGYAKAVWTKGGNTYAPKSGEVSTDNTDLTTIARKSILNSVQIVFDENDKIKVTPSITKYSSSFTDDLVIYSGNKTITLNNLISGTTYTLTDSQQNLFYDFFGTSTNVTVSCYLITKSGVTTIGNSSVVPALVTLPSYSLELTASVVDNLTDYNKYKNNDSDLIANISVPKLTFNAISTTGKTYGRDIEYYANNVLVTSPTIVNGYAGGIFKIVATDGRKTDTFNSDNIIIPYQLPSLECSLVRTSSTGTSAKVELKGTYYDGNGLKDLANLYLKFVYKESNGEEVTITDFDIESTTNTTTHIVSFTATATITGLNYKQGISYNAFMKDLIEKFPNNIVGSIPAGEPVWNAYRDSSGENHFNINGIFENNGEPFSSGNPEPYPVGSIYLSVNEVDPSSLFGGQWQKLEDVFLVAAGSTYSAGLTGGSRTHSHNFSHTHTGSASHYHGLGSGFAEINHNSSAFHFVEKSGSYTSTGRASVSGATESVSQSEGIALGGTTDSATVSITTSSQSSITTGNASNEPPFLAVYMWKRIA